jgi:hypothetical protein
MQLAILTERVRCNSISASRNAVRRWCADRPTPDHDRVADPIETVISELRLDMLGNNPKDFQI